MNIRAQVYGGFQPIEEPLLKAKHRGGTKTSGLQKVAVHRETRRSSHNRDEDRHRLTDERARLTHKRRNHDVELINLSGGGAMIAGKLPLKLWDRVTLHLGDHGDIECAVRWIRDGKAGLEFAHETQLAGTSDQVAIVLRHVIERSFPHIKLPKKAPPVKADPVKQQRGEEHRDSPRHPLIWNGLLHHDYQTTNIRIRNISATGAMIESHEPVRVGTEPLLELNDAISMAATVEWAVGDQVGLRFHLPFDLERLSEVRPSVAPTDWTPPAYLDVDNKVANDPWGRMTVSQLRQELEGFLKR